MQTTTIQIPQELRARLERLKAHPRQPYYEVIVAALDRVPAQAAAAPSGPAGNPDPLIQRHRKALKAMARKHGLRIGIFGSRARGTARQDSDLDVVYTLEPDRTLLDAVGFKQDAEELIGVKVDLLSAEGIHRPKLKSELETEAFFL
jgi:predicted nucleotidyltransferase